MCLASFSTDDDDDHEDDRRGHSRRLRAARALARSLTRPCSPLCMNRRHHEVIATAGLKQRRTQHTGCWG
jgi:hypothetical protein